MAGEARRKRLRALLKLAGAAGTHPSAFDEAFVHESAVRERLAPRSNERLEFLGDAIVGNVVARSLFERYPDAAEGELALRKSSLVSDAALADTAQRLEFDALLVLGAGHANEAPSRRRSALANAFEAFVAALDRACGRDVVAAFIAREHVAERERRPESLDDPKTLLQEWLQKHHAALPHYTERFEGPDHDRTFFAHVALPDDIVATGSGPSKKLAQRAAAAAALAQLAERYDDLEPRVLSRPAGAPAAGAGKKRRPARTLQPKRGGASKRART